MQYKSFHAVAWVGDAHVARDHRGVSHPRLTQLGSVLTNPTYLSLSLLHDLLVLEFERGSVV